MIAMADDPAKPFPSLKPPPLPFVIGNTSHVWILECVATGDRGMDLRFTARTPRGWMTGLVFGVPLAVFGSIFVWGSVMSPNSDGTRSELAVLGALALLLSPLFALGSWYHLRESVAAQRRSLPEGGVVARWDRDRIWVAIGGALRAVDAAQIARGQAPINEPVGKVLSSLPFSLTVIAGRDAETGEPIAATIDVAGPVVMGCGSELAIQRWARAAGMRLQTTTFMPHDLD